MSFLTRHRTICDTITEIRELAEKSADKQIVKLCDEALTYARSMSAKLEENKKQREAHAQMRVEKCGVDPSKITAGPR